MQFNHVFIPYGSYWSTPFVRWQGNFAQQHPMLFAADVAKRFLREREITPQVFDALFLGITVPAEHCFYGAPWLAGLIDAPGISGPTVNQACATSARVIGDFLMRSRPTKNAVFWPLHVIEPAMAPICTIRTHQGQAALVQQKTGSWITSTSIPMLTMP